MDLHHEKHALPSSIWQIVLKGTQTSESVFLNYGVTQTKSYGLEKLGITPEASSTFLSLNIQLPLKIQL